MPFVTDAFMAEMKQRDAIARETEANLSSRLAACQQERDTLKAKLEALEKRLHPGCSCWRCQGFAKDPYGEEEDNNE